MKIFGYQITRAKDTTGRKDDRGLLARDAQGQGPFTAVFQGWLARKVQPSLYEALRESIPVIDTAIERLTSLDGVLQVEGDNKPLVREIEDWAGSVQVNDKQRGLQAFIDNFSNETYEQGFSISEFVANVDRTDIVRLNVADSKDIRFRRSDTGLETWYKGRSTATRTRGATDQVGDILQGNLSADVLAAHGWYSLAGDNLLYYSIGNENHNPYGVSVMRSMEFVSKTLLTIQNATANVWERFGDPTYAVTYKAGKRELGAGTLEERRAALATAFNEVISAKRAGRSADFINAVDQNSEINIKVIGSDGQVLEMEVPARHMLEQIVAKSKLPAWLLGFHWSTTERLAKYEVEILLQEAEIRAGRKLLNLNLLVETMLRMRSRKWKRDDFVLSFRQPNLHDLVANAQARFLNAQADMYDRGDKGGEKPPAPEKPKAVGAQHAAPLHEDKSCGCPGVKEFQRPKPWPELDKVEKGYEDELKYDWAELKDRVFTILRLAPVGAQNSVPSRKDAPGDIPPPSPIDAFSFTDEQRGAIMDAMKEFTGAYDYRGTDSAVRWYYGQAYSLGLIQAAQFVGQERPILDIIKNSEIFDDLVKSGFQLVKDNATKAIVERILPEMQAQVIAGTNPVHVAARLEKLFGAANSDWERLARSEMSMAAERAKLDEWAEWKVKQVEFTPAPDACAICISLAGDYPIAKAPVPVKDTHPRCRCSTRPAASEA